MGEWVKLTAIKFSKQRFVGYQAFRFDFKVTRKMNDFKLIFRLQ